MRCLILLGHKRGRCAARRDFADCTLFWEGMSPQSAHGQAVSVTYELLLLAAARRQPVAAIYDGLPRLLCPHVLGRKAGQFHALVYQIGGKSKSLPVVLSDSGVWRCLAVEKLSQVEFRDDAWRSGPRSRPQTCIDEIDFNTDDQPGDDPQKGQ
jgi:hypothetical protein